MFSAITKEGNLWGKSANVCFWIGQIFTALQGGDVDCLRPPSVRCSELTVDGLEHTATAGLLGGHLCAEFSIVGP
jgi:hypothetical protein